MESLSLPALEEAEKADWLVIPDGATLISADRIPRCEKQALKQALEVIIHYPSGSAALGRVFVNGNMLHVKAAVFYACAYPLDQCRFYTKDKGELIVVRVPPDKFAQYDPGW